MLPALAAFCISLQKSLNNWGTRCMVFQNTIWNMLCLCLCSNRTFWPVPSELWQQPGAIYRVADFNLPLFCFCFLSFLFWVWFFFNFYFLDSVPSWIFFFFVCILHWQMWNAMSKWNMPSRSCWVTKKGDVRSTNRETKPFLCILQQNSLECLVPLWIFHLSV